MRKRTINITESQLRRLVRRTLNENWNLRNDGQDVFSPYYVPTQFRDIWEYYENPDLSEREIKEDMIKVLDHIAEKMDVSPLLDDLYEVMITDYADEEEVGPRERYTKFSDFIRTGIMIADDIFTELRGAWERLYAKDVYKQMMEDNPYKYTAYEDEGWQEEEPDDNYRTESRKAAISRVVESVIRRLRESIEDKDINNEKTLVNLGWYLKDDLRQYGVVSAYPFGTVWEEKMELGLNNGDSIMLDFGRKADGTIDYIEVLYWPEKWDREDMKFGRDMQHAFESQPWHQRVYSINGNNVFHYSYLVDAIIKMIKYWRDLEINESVLRKIAESVTRKPWRR